MGPAAAVRGPSQRTGFHHRRKGMTQRQSTMTSRTTDRAAATTNAGESSPPESTQSQRRPGPRPKRGVPEGLWLKCNGCGATIYRKEAEKMLNVCPQCGFHWYVSARQRIDQLFDPGTFEEWDG